MRQSLAGGIVREVSRRGTHTCEHCGQFARFIYRKADLTGEWREACSVACFLALCPRLPA